MQMNVLVSAVLFLFIGPFDRASSWEAKTTDSAILQVNPQHVFISVNEALVLNCSITTPNHGLLPSQLLWKHNNVWILNSSHVVDNSTVQLRISPTRYEDAGVYGCGVFYNSSLPTQNLTVVVGEKPKLIPGMLTLVNASGKPVQELTLQWTAALQINVTYKLFLGRPHHYDFVFNNRTVCTWSWMLRNKSKLLCRVGKDVLGQLFKNLSDLIDHSKCNNQFFKCDALCAKVVAQNAFGTSEDTSSTWNLLEHARCPPPRHLNVISGDYGVRVSWQRPLLVWKEFQVFYQLTYNGTQVLSGMRLPATSPLRPNFEELNYTVTGLVPFSRYKFAVSCKFVDLPAYESGPSVYIEMTSEEEVPAEAPTCKVTNKSIDGRSFVSLKPPPKSTWNGMPRRYVVDYVHRDQHNSVNVSLGGLNKDRPLGVWLNDTEAHKNYSVRVTMCTGAGCRENFSQPCFIDAVTEDSNSEVGGDSLNPELDKGKAVWAVPVTWRIVIALASAMAGLSLCAFMAFLIKRKRSRRRQRPSLETLLVGLEFPNGSRDYENDPDDGPSLCEESQHYDTIPLKDVDCTVGKSPVTEIEAKF